MLHKQTISLYGYMHKLFFQKVMQSCPDASLHPGQTPLLQCLLHEGNCSQAQLSKILNVSPAAVAVSLKRLEKQGMIKRTVNPQSQRENIIVLTQEGEQVTKDIADAIESVLERVFQGLEEDEILAFETVIRKICANLTSNDEEKQGQHE